MIRRVAALALLAAGIGCSVPAAAQAPAATQPFAGMACELHVWALGRPNFVPKSNMMVRYTPPTAEQLADPNSTVNIFAPVKRAQALGDTPLGQLFPGAASVTITRHEEVIDMDKTPINAIKARLTPSTAPCYGDLVLANMYAIFPNPDAPYVMYGIGGGLLASAIAGGDRLVMDFWLQQWPGTKGKPQVFRRKNDTPLPHVRPASAEMAAAVKDSADANLAIFAETVAAKRAK
ncbi:MAG: hypothetical protein ACOVNS_07135 [Erythrobacter sp.]